MQTSDSSRRELVSPFLAWLVAHSFTVFLLLSVALGATAVGAASFSTDFNSGQPPGMTLFGQATVNAGFLKLTTAQNGQFGIAYIEDFGGHQLVQEFRATFKAALFGSTCCNNGASPADGFSFNLVPASSTLSSPGYAQPGEEGLDQGLVVSFDTWDNGLGEAPAIEVKWLGQVIARAPFQPSQSPAGITDPAAALRAVDIHLEADGTIDVSYGGTLVVSNVQTPYDPAVIGVPKWVLGARTGAANDNHCIDDLAIEALAPTQVTFCRDFNAGQPAGTTLFGQATVDAGFLKLTPAQEGVFGIAYIDNFSAGHLIQAFRATFTTALFGSTCCNNGANPADGFSFNLVPARSALSNPGYGQPAEEGLDQGLAVTFDTWDNGAAEAPAIEVKWLGQVIAREPFQPSQSPAGITDPTAARRDVSIDLEADGTIDVSYGGTLVLNNVPTPYDSGVIGVPKWVLGARTGAANDNHWIDDLCILTLLTPPPSGPRLEIFRESAAEVRLCWPVSASGYVLQCTTNLTSPIPWTTLAAQPELIADKLCVLLPIDFAHARFYRLCNPEEAPPVITGLAFDQTNVIERCETLFLTAKAESCSAATLSYQWGIVAAPPGVPGSLISTGHTAIFVSQTIGAYTLQVIVTDDRNRSSAFTFPVTVIDGLLCDLRPGEAAVQTVQVGPRTVIGAPFPPFEIEREEGRNDEPALRVPNGPLRGNLQPSVSAINAQLFEPPIGAGPQNVFGRNDPVVFARSTGYGRVVTFAGSPPDMSGAAGGNVVFTTGNTWAALSTDSGGTFTALNPTTIFPSTPSRDAAGNLIDGGLCCDQVVQYAPQIDRYIWLMQFWGPVVGTLNGPNMLRIASASTADMINSGGTAWTYWDLRSATFGLGNGFMDYPDMAVGNNSLYVSVDVVGRGLLVLRIPLAQIAAGGTINIDYTNPDNSVAAYGGHITQRTGDAVFWAGHNSTSQMRIWTLPEGSGVYSWRDININSWPNGSRVSTTPSGVDWLNFGFPGAACIGATRRYPDGPSEIWFAWTAPAGGGFTHPHIQMVRFNDSSFALLEQVQVWNGSHAYAYPSLITNQREEVGMALAFGGGGILEASSAVGIWGDFVVWTPGYSTSSNNRWGDYLSVRQYPQRDGQLYAASVYNILNLGSGNQFNPIYILFGRRSVVP